MFDKEMILFFLLMVMVLLSVAFFTLMERKILGYLHIRKGPNKALFSGLLQPVMDGVKLFLKENFFSLMGVNIFFFLFPMFLFILMLLYWLLYCLAKQEIFTYSLLYFLIISGLGVYSVMGSGWSSNSSYSLLGAYRSVAQVVSYEVCLVFILLSIFFFSQSLVVSSFIYSPGLNLSFFWGFFLVFLIWFIVILAELNRAPFDFAESESELVSGFNVEFGSIKFAFLFLGEYGNMLFMCYLSGVLFFLDMYGVFLVLLFLMVWVRGVFPRYRYDILMNLNWKVYLPFILFFYYFIFLLLLFFY